MPCVIFFQPRFTRPIVATGHVYPHSKVATLASGKVDQQAYGVTCVPPVFSAGVERAEVRGAQSASAVCQGSASRWPPFPCPAQGLCPWPGLAATAGCPAAGAPWSPWSWEALCRRRLKSLQPPSTAAGKPGTLRD
jgi:hypothetical protein